MASLLYLCPSQHGSETMFTLRMGLLPGQIHECWWLTRIAIFLGTYVYQKAQGIKSVET